MYKILCPKHKFTSFPCYISISIVGVLPYFTTSRFLIAPSNIPPHAYTRPSPLASSEVSAENLFEASNFCRFAWFLCAGFKDEPILDVEILELLAETAGWMLKKIEHILDNSNFKVFFACQLLGSIGALIIHFQETLSRGRDQSARQHIAHLQQSELMSNSLAVLAPSELALRQKNVSIRG